MSTDLLSAMFSESAVLLTEATHLKETGDLDASIEKLRHAYQVAAIEGIDHGIQTHLRLPMYLQKAGRFDEAWAEFNRLSVEGYPAQSALPRDVWIAVQGIIFDKMRLSLQREGMPTQAVRFGVWSIVCQFGEGISEDWYQVNQEWIRGQIAKLLKKAKRKELETVIVAMIETELTNPKFDLSKLGDRIDEMLRPDLSGYP